MSLDLRPNEFVKIEVHFSYKVFVVPMLLMSIGIILFLAVWSGAIGGFSIEWLGRVFKASSLFILIGCALFIPYFYKRLDNKLKIYAVTNQRVYIRRGIMNIHEKDIPLAKINDVQVMQSLSQRMFGAGNVIIQVGNDESKICIEDVNRPREFRDTVLEAIYDLQRQEEEQRREYQQQQQPANYGAPDGYGQPPYQGYPPQGGYGQGYPQGGYNQGYGQGYNQGNYGQGGYDNGYGNGYGGNYGNPGNYGNYGNPDDYNNNGGYDPTRF